MDLAICRVCLGKDNELIDIFGTDGSRLGIKIIVGQHFWFQVSVSDD